MTKPEKKKSYAELIAEEFISNLEKGTSFLQKRWEAGELVAPYNAISGKPYRGVNNMRLTEKRHGDPRWLTFLQASQIGGKVRKGEKGTPILYWVFEERKRARDEETGKPLFDEDGNPKYEVIKLKKPKAIRSIVYNASQIDGIPEYKPEIRDPNLVNSRVEKIIENLGVVVRNNYQDRAFYSPRLDEIHMPNFDQFEDPNAYYSTLLHEGVHSTGHETRMNRDFGSRFGDVRYAKEELRAEIASYMLSQKLGVEFDPNHHYAYVNSWIKVLKDDPREIIRACSDAEKITEYVLSFDLEREVDNDNLYQVLEPISLDEEQEAFNEKIYLNVPFSEKNEAKDLGAKWDRNKKSWYCPSNLDLKESKLDRWFDREHDEKLNPEKYNTKVDDSPDRVLVDNDYVSYEVIKEKLTWDYDKSKIVSEDNPIVNPMLQDLYDTYIDKLKENGLSLIKKDDSSLEIVSDEGIYPMEFGSISIEKSGNNEIFNLRYSEIDTELMRRYMEFGGDGDILSVRKFHREQDHFRLDRSIDTIIESYSSCKNIQLEYQKPTEKVFIDVSESDVAEGLLPTSVMLDEDRDLYFIDQRDDDFFEIISKYKPISVDSALNRSNSLVNSGVDYLSDRLTTDVITPSNPIDNDYLMKFYEINKEALDKSGLRLINVQDKALRVESVENTYPYLYAVITLKNDKKNEPLLNASYFLYGEDSLADFWKDGGKKEDIKNVRMPHFQEDFKVESSPTFIKLVEERKRAYEAIRDNNYPQSLESDNTTYKVIKEKLTWDYDKSKVVSEDNPITNPMLQDLYDTYIDKLKENGLNLIKRNDWSLNVVSDQGVYPMEFGSISVKKDNDNNDVLELSYSTRSDESIKKYMELGGANRYILSDHKSYEEQNIAELSGGIDSIIESHSQCKKIQIEYQTPAEKVFIDINKSDIDKDFLYMSVSLDEDRGLYFVDQRNSDFNSIISKYKPIDVDSALNRKGDKLADLDNEKLKATEKIYIDVPYLEKNEAKSLGAKWDRKEKSWYIPEGEEIEKFKKWNEPKIPEREISVEEQFSIALESVGIKSDPHHSYNNDGAIHRLPTHDDKGSKVSGAYALHLNQKIPGGWIKNMKTGEEINWKADVKVASLSEKEIEELKREAEIAREIRERNIKEKQDLTAKVSSVLWDQSLDGIDHQYAKDKGMSATKYKVVPYFVSEEAEKMGVNVSDSIKEIQEFKKQGEYAFKTGDMVIPLMNAEGEVRSVQTISSYGDSKSFKSFATGGEKQGMFYQTDGELPKGDKPIYIAEGIATADAVSQITESPVVSVFDAGNIKPVVEALREKFPKTEIIIASDNDHHQKIINGKKLPNVGVEKAREVAKEFNCLVVTPDFDPKDKGTDWNDLLVDKGLEKARSDFSKELSRERDQVNPDFDR